MKLVVGLGNPGSRYEKTRHNVGFMVLDALADRVGGGWRSGKGEYAMAESSHAGQKMLLVKPTTYMNNSGLAVRDVVHFYKVPVEDLLVVCDDAALPFGALRMRTRGTDGGQNGLKSVIYHIQTDVFARLRIGIANDRTGQMDLADFVLSRFENDENAVLDTVVRIAADAVMTWSAEGVEKAMNQFNRTTIAEKTDTKEKPNKESPDA